MKTVALAIVVGLCACAGVLGLVRETPARAFPHRAHVESGVACTKCHVDATLPDETACTTCHAKPHDARPCLTCHATPGIAEQLAEVRDHLRFDHRAHAATTRGNCARCHDEDRRPPMATCFKCHDKSRDARDCNACHKNLEDTSTLPATHLAHDGDWRRDHGPRAASSGDVCASCHAEKFCATCHGATMLHDPLNPAVHRDSFAARHALEAKADPGACSTCHQPSRCTTCHVAKGVAGPDRKSPHPIDWVGIDGRHGREARRDPAACAACHDGAGQQLCVSCHAVGGIGGNPHPAGWSSRQPLTALPCRLCHPIGSPR